VPQSFFFRLSPPTLFLLWLATLLLLLAGLGTPVTQRTQEARVLETAREMLASQDFHQWLIPRLNEKVRMEKPPLAYWITAGSFRLFGVSEFAGRLPFALMGWILIAIVYRFAKRLIDAQFAFFSAAILLTSWMFFSHFRLAETDAPATVFLTAAVYWLWRGGTETRSARSFAWFDLAGVMIGLAALAKSPFQGAFAILFFIFWALVHKNWSALARLLLSGGLLIALVCGGWWYFYAHTSPYASVLWTEVLVVTRGEDHVGHFYNYFPWVLRAVLPWTGLVVLGAIWGICIMLFTLFGHYSGWNDRFGWMYKDRGEESATRDHAVRTLICWSAAIFIPLLLGGNKQNHYLVPMMPPLAMLAAYALCRGLAPDCKEAPLVRWVIGITFALSLLTPVAVFVISRHLHQPIQSAELALILVLLAAMIATLIIARWQGALAGVAAYAAGMALAYAVMLGRWVPSLDQVHHRAIAAELRAAYKNGPYVFYGKDFSLPLIWNLRQAAPLFEKSQDLEKELDKDPETVVITEAKNNHQPPQVPPRLQKVAELETGDEGGIFRVYEVKP
jgi:4-amino-4-deoxy-L-arabinose transferase-like glycosyltransferase